MNTIYCILLLICLDCCNCVRVQQPITVEIDPNGVISQNIPLPVIDNGHGLTETTYSLEYNNTSCQGFLTKMIGPYCPTGVNCPQFPTRIVGTVSCDTDFRSSNPQCCGIFSEGDYQCLSALESTGPKFTTRCMNNFYINYTLSYSNCSGNITATTICSQPCNAAVVKPSTYKCDNLNLGTNLSLCCAQINGNEHCLPISKKQIDTCYMNQTLSFTLDYNDQCQGTITELRKPLCPPGKICPQFIIVESHQCVNSYDNQNSKCCSKFNDGKTYCVSMSSSQVNKCGYIPTEEYSVSYDIDTCQGFLSVTTHCGLNCTHSEQNNHVYECDTLTVNGESKCCALIPNNTDISKVCVSAVKPFQCGCRISQSFKVVTDGCKGEMTESFARFPPHVETKCPLYLPAPRTRECKMSKVDDDHYQCCAVFTGVKHCRLVSKNTTAICQSQCQSEPIFTVKYDECQGKLTVGSSGTELCGNLHKPKMNYDCKNSFLSGGPDNQTGMCCANISNDQFYCQSVPEHTLTNCPVTAVKNTGVECIKAPCYNVYEPCSNKYIDYLECKPLTLVDDFLCAWFGVCSRCSEVKQFNQMDPPTCSIRE
jgi:hypothetical protein